MNPVNQFVCNLKEDVSHAFGDQITFWSFRAYVFAADISLNFFGSIDEWLFYHGWLILLLWRFCNVFLDSYKRVRDFKKAEWKSNVVPLLKEQAVRERKKSFWHRIFETLKKIFK